MIPFEEALELCIEAVHQGTPVDDCLARYPEHAPRLAPLLSVARELYSAPLEVMSETGFERQRARLRQGLQARQAPATNGHVANGIPLNGASPNGVHANGASPNGVHPNGKPANGAVRPVAPPTARPPTKAPRWAGLFDWPRWATLTTQKAALMTVVALLAVAASLGGVTLASAKAAPDEPLYQVKRLVETVVDWIPAPAEAQAGRALDRAEERLAESRAVCVANPMRAVELQQQMEQERQRALRLLEQLTSPTAEGLRQRAGDMQTRAAALLRECVAASAPAPSANIAPAALPPLTPTATDTLTPAPSAPLAVPSQAPTVGQAGVSNTATVEAPTATATRSFVQPAKPAAPEPTRVPPTAASPAQAEPPTATLPPATDTPAPSATPAPPPSPVPPSATPAPPATPTLAPTQAPTVGPTSTPPWTPVVEPTRTPVPTDEPRPTEPPPTLSPATPVPSVAPPPTPTLRLVEITKVPTQAPPPTQPPPPTARPLEATATPGRPQPTDPPRPPATATPKK